MVNMAEAETGAMFIQHRLQHPNGVGQESTTSDDMDSEPEEAPILIFQQTKRNKRKNFMPRNISYSETESLEEMRGDSSRDSSPLDLSNSESALEYRSHKRFRKTLLNVSTPTTIKRTETDRHSPDSAPAPAPIDLSFTKAQMPSDTESDCESLTKPSPQQYLLHHAFLPQPTDASDLKEYAQNTVKELLEIYGLNSPEVAESITNNVPISNFSSGKILESLSARAFGGVRGPSSPGSQPPTPPRTPLSPHSKVSPAPMSLPRHKLPGLDSVAAKFAVNSPHVPNSRVALPQNISTILALAAMQESRPSNKQGGSNTPTAPPNTSAARTPTPTPAHTPVITTASESSGAAAAVVRRLPSPPRDSSKSGLPIDYSRYVKRFGSALECGSKYCKEVNYREHFHCSVCNSRVFVKKEDMIRHFKWHKKRDESLQHGFMRYSPGDDCSDRYSNCTHNRKQTHYHCIQGTCDKVYISTSDVQMHANYHRKDSAIIKEGFQRLRATEECRTPYCAFYGQRTTHFHCRRDHCQFTFKNKADMEKHKTYHIKDEQLARDGFKKFLKPDICGFPNCRFSQVCNHIHCVRDGCSYVLHSSGQLLSHKRKHERKDSEIAYRKFKLAQQAVVNIANNDQISQHGDGSNLSPSTSGSLQLLHQASSLAALTALHDSNFSSSSSEGRVSPITSISVSTSTSVLGPVPTPTTSSTSSSSSVSIPQVHTTQTSTTPAPTTPLQLKLNPGTPPSPFFIDQMAPSMPAIDLSSDETLELWPRFMTHTTASQLCSVGTKCSLYQKDHFHCKDPSCEIPFRCLESAENHARMHETQEQLNENFYQENAVLCQETCPHDKHYHCTWEGCGEAVLPGDRLEHIRAHEISAAQSNSLDALFRRKRGRPPKNRVIEVWNDYAGGSGSDSPQAIFTSFKLPKPAPSGGTTTPQPEASDLRTPSPAIENSTTKPSLQMLEMHGFQVYTDSCPDSLCLFSPKPQHYHCTRPRCFFATDSEEQLLAHSKDFHDSIEILDGFLFFDKSVDCRMESCHSNKVNRHFHCIRPGCGYSFVRYSSMTLHQAKHLAESCSGPGRSPVGSDVSVDLSTNSNPIEIKVEREPSPARSSPLHSPEVNVNNTCSATTPTTTTAVRSVVKASGTFYPLCGLSNIRSSSPSSPGSDIIVKSEPTNEAVLPEWMSVERHERYGPDTSCSRPFCKLKRKEHYHCNACNQAFSELERLRPHIAKHSPGAIPNVMVKPENNNNEETDELQHPGGPNVMPMNIETSEMIPPPPHYPGFSAAAMAAAVAANQQLALITSQGIPFMSHAMPALYTSPSGLMFAAPPGFNPHHPAALMGNGLLDSARSTMLDPSNNERHVSKSRSHSPPRDISPEAKKARVQTSMRILKDEPVPEGYLRFRFNEDCRYSHCGYREHQTHFHCMRQDCGYSFCDKTRFVQHTARHERLDTLMGGDFQQYRANVSCGRPDCVYTSTLGTVQNKASHFHCLKCEFVCTDTNKVVAHRRQHQKLDSIMAAGFEKFTPSQPCSAPDTCIHSGKQTHYHCLSCQYAVLGLSQMTAHKYRHLE
ncbi:zinc finger protein castor homolog 1-like isoform X2 [Lycorma delicatula]